MLAVERLTTASEKTNKFSIITSNSVREQLIRQMMKTKHEDVTQKVKSLLHSKCAFKSCINLQ